MQDSKVSLLIAELRSNLDRAADLVSRGRAEFDRDPAIPLACEALSNRVGEAAKRLVRAAPRQFADPIWSQAAMYRDFIVHHYDRIDLNLLWNTVTVSFPELAAALDVTEGMTDGA